MCATSIKNSILFLLIILIVHFLLKNALLDKQQKEPFGCKKAPSPLATVPETITPACGRSLKDVASPLKEQPSRPTTPQKKYEPDQTPVVECKTDDDKDLYDFVYGSEEIDDATLNKFFTGSDVTHDVEKDITSKMSCNVLRMKDEDMQVPISTTCDPALKAKTSADIKAVKADCNIPQNIPVMVLQEYDNESSMNGADPFEGLSAFDTLAQSYEVYNV